MNSRIACIAALSLVVTCLVPLGAGANDGNVRVPFSAEGSGAAGPAAEGGASPEIGFIISDNPGCYQPDPAVDRCLISFSRLAVDASPNYMVTLTLEINGRFIARYGGFFQTGMDLGGTPLGQGIKVPCGKRNEGGVPTMGRKYTYTLRAEDSATLKSANYGTLWCPPFRGPLPLVP